MKKYLFSFIAAITLSIFCFIACVKDTVTEHYTFYRPVYETRQQVINNIKNNAPQAIQNPGKLFIKDNYFFLNDVNRGVHIIDYSNPTQPKNIGFIDIPGNVDIAVRGNYLYADCYTSLVTIDISDPSNVKLQQFINGVFPEQSYFSGMDTSKIIVSWVRVDTSVTHKFNAPSNFGGGILAEDFFAMNPSYNSGNNFSNNSQINGTGGSMARFALLNNNMYTVSTSTSDLKIFNTTDAANPQYVQTIPLPQHIIETIFPYQNKLFIGSQTGMFIYDASNANNPVLLGEFGHVQSCDPVIADGNFAYVTLRSNSMCGGNANELDALDITNITNPLLINSYPLTDPHGLSKDGNLLFICDGAAGLKIFNASNANVITPLKQINDLDTYDVIAQNKIAIVVATDGLYFIDYSNVQDAKIIGKISVSKG
ncbi:MAG: LVIVD repeat-containing protein [Chitinophagaceae bacterium]